MTPWEWLARILRGIQTWIGSDATRTMVANASLLLIIGGLAILFLIVTLFLLQSVFPTKLSPLAAAKGKRQLRPAGPLPEILPAAPVGAARRRELEAMAATPRIDTALDEVVRAGLGEPRILRDVPHYFLVRLLGCRGCGANPTGGLRAHAPMCEYERDIMQAALRRVYTGPLAVREVNCLRMGHPSCEFEVRH